MDFINTLNSLLMDKINFYNLEIRYISDNEVGRNPIPFQSPLFIHYVGVSGSEIKSYLNFIKTKQFGNKYIGNQEFEIVRPKWIKIFDYSKVSLPSGSTRSEHITAFEEKHQEDLTKTQVFKMLGKEVTYEFGINLE